MAQLGALPRVDGGSRSGGCGTTKPASEGTRPAATADRAATQETSTTLVAEGQRVFRFDTFGDEQLWTDTSGIGHRKDGWPNRDLIVGAIIALSPALSEDKKPVYASWGPGKYDPRYGHPPYFHDGGAATLADVVAHYNRVRALGLAGEQQRDLVEYLKSL